MAGYCFEQFGRRVVVDTTGQVLLAELDERASWSERAQGSSPEGSSPDDPFRRQHDEVWRAPIHASVASAGLRCDFTPMFALLAKRRAFDERLVARLEHVLHHGVADREGSFRLVDRIRVGLPAGTEMRGLLDAATFLARGAWPEPGVDQSAARRWIACFELDPMQSQPTGGYTRSTALERIFRYDRLLQWRLGSVEASAVAEVLRTDPALLLAYQAHLALVGRLVGPPATPSVLEAKELTAILPAARSVSDRLLEELLGTSPIPEGFELGPELVARIRDGRLPTAPGPDDGWPAHQLHASAALLQPATEGLEVGPRYAEELEQTFEAQFARDRDTHVKQRENLGLGGIPFVIAPRVTVEPLPEHYARAAEGYRFVREQLVEHLGEAVVRGIQIDDYGRVGPTIHDALLEMELLLRGAEVVSRAELGRPLPATAEHDAAQASFRSWQRRSADDPDLAVDLRSAVPVFTDPGRRTVRVGVTLGVETRSLRFDFVQRPGVSIRGTSTFGNDEPDYRPAQAMVLCPITIACDVRALPTRERLRRVCDEHQTPAAIKEALQAG
ncbi:MAG: hypothetical protein KDK70_17480 [Myxococcales bacterium]|nr:hypothetical protein [Myxococcales bacterium]